jgi:hypothetical protein
MSYRLKILMECGAAGMLMRVDLCGNVDEEVLGIRREERGSGHPDGRGKVGEGFLRESDPVHEVSVELGLIDTDGVAMEFTVGRDQIDLRGLDLRDRVERCRSLSDAERCGLNH